LRKQLALDSTHGALIGTSAAIQASAGVDDVLTIALGDSAHGATLGASTAHDASISNNKSHFFTPPFDYYIINIITQFLKNATVFYSR
jgi:hypothetical protein